MSLSNGEWIAVAVCLATVVLGIVAVALGAKSVDWDVRCAQRRAAALPAVAAAINADYVADDSSVLASFGGATPFVRGGHSATATHVMRGVVGDVPAAFFDLHVQAADVATDEDVSTTVAMFDLGPRGLPAFTLRRVRALETPAAPSRIDLPEDRDFAKRFLILSDDEAGMRRLLTPQLRAFIVDHRDWAIESTGRWLAVCRHAEPRPSAEAYPTFVAEASAFIHAFGTRR